MSSILALFYEEGSFGIFVLVSIILGGGAAALAGRAIALTWRTRWQVVSYMLILGAAVRFVHFALFGGTLLSVHYYVVDASICMAFGLPLDSAPMIASSVEAGAAGTQREPRAAMSAF